MQPSSASRVDGKRQEGDSKQHSPDLSFGDVSLNGDELFSGDDVDDESEQQSPAYSSPSAHQSPSEKMRLRNERRRRRSQLEIDRRIASGQSQPPHDIHTLNHHSRQSSNSLSVSSSPHLSSQPHSRRSSASIIAAQQSTTSAEQPLHDAQIATLLLPLSTSLPLPTLHSRLSSLRSALHASHRQLTDYRSLLSDKQQQQAEEKQINYDLFMKVKEQDEHIQWLTHALKQANSSSGAGMPTTDGGEPERLTLRGMRGVALHAAHMQLREMMGEVDKRANEIRRLEEQVRTLKIEKEGRSEGDSNEIERLRQEVAVLMGKLAVEVEEREQRDRERSRQERKLEKQVEKLRQQRQSLEHDLLQSAAEVNTLSSALSSLRQQHSTLTFDHQHLLDDKVKAEQEREGWRKRYEDVMDEVDTMRSEVRDAREVSDGIGRLVEGSDNLEVRRVRDECDGKLAAMQEEVRAMQRAVMDTKRGLKVEVEARVQQQTAALHSELRQLRDNREREVDQWKAEVTTAQHEHDEAEVENEQLRQRLRQLTQQLEQTTQSSTATTRSIQAPQQKDAEQKDDNGSGKGNVDPSLLAVLRAELDSVRAINQRLTAAQQQAENSAHTQLDAARKQMSDMENRLHNSERREQQLQDELSNVERRLEAQRQHKVEEEQKHGQDEKYDPANDAVLQQREQQWQYDRSQLLQSLTALTAKSKERESVVSKLMEKIAALEAEAQRASRAVERENAAPPAASGPATLSASVNGYSSLRSPVSGGQPHAAAPLHDLRVASPGTMSLSASSAPSMPVPTTFYPRPVPLSPAAGELLSDSLLDQLASRLAAKLNHAERPAPPRLTPPRATGSSSPVRARQIHDEDGGRIGEARRAESSADIAAEMAAIYRQLEGKSRTFSQFAQNNASSARTTARVATTAARSDRRTSKAGRVDDDDGELKEVEPDDYIPLIRRTVGGHTALTKPLYRRSPATSVQPSVMHGRAATKAVRVSSSSHAYSPTSSLLSSAASSPASSTPSARPPAPTTPPMSPCSLSPSLSSSVASTSTLSPPSLSARASTGTSVVYGGIVRVQQQQRASSGRTR